MSSVLNYSHGFLTVVPSMFFACCVNRSDETKTAEMAHTSSAGCHLRLATTKYLSISRGRSGGWQVR